MPYTLHVILAIRCDAAIVAGTHYLHSEYANRWNGEQWPIQKWRKENEA